MPSYTVHFKNSTQDAYHFAVYQKYPDCPGLDSVAWQVRGLGPGATNRVDWTLDYQVAIADWDTNAGQYSGCQVVPADWGKVYEVVTLEGDIPVVNKTPIKTTDDGLIKLHNNTSPAKAVTLGLLLHKNWWPQKEVRRQVSVWRSASIPSTTLPATELSSRASLSVKGLNLSQ